MPEISLRKFGVHYFLSPADRAAQHRLDQLRMKVLNEAFRSAIDRANVPPDAELCIRNVSAPVRFRLNSSEQTIVACWSSALAQNLTEILRDVANSGRVFYYSRRQAVFDLVLSVSRRDYQRAWAWQLMELWKPELAGDRDAVIQLVRVLCRNANLIVPALRWLSTTGFLPALARRLSAEQWAELAAAASANAGVNLAPDMNGELPPSRAYNHALHVLRRSGLLAGVIASRAPATESKTIGKAIATLAILEVEPALLGTEIGPSLLKVVAASFEDNQGESWAPFTPSDPAGAADPADLTDREQSMVTVDEQPSTSARRHQPAQAIRPHGPNQLSDDAALGFSSSGVSTHRTARESLALLDTERDNAAANEVLDPRRQAFSEFGGLLFLIAVVEALKLPEEILNNAVLGSRTLTWTLHQLALALVPADPDDAAVFAFAGLPPDAIPPSKQEPPANANETDALQHYAGRIVESLSALMDYEYESAVELLEFVCRRRAEIVADPAWIEIRFSLDQVSTEIRRAGLDLDPGYVSWLGVVMKFVYE